MGSSSSTSYSCVNGVLTTSSYSDTACTNRVNVTTQSLPSGSSRCQTGNDVGSNEQAYVVQSCVSESMPTGYLLSNFFNSTDCTPSTQNYQSYSALGECYQLYNSSLSTLQVTGSYIQTYVPGTVSGSFGVQTTYFADGRCMEPRNGTTTNNDGTFTFNTTCQSQRDFSETSSYMSGTNIPVNYNLPLVISSYSTAYDCSSNTAPAEVFYAPAGQCFRGNATFSQKFVYSNGQFTRTIYTDASCQTGAQSSVISDPTCIPNPGGIPSRSESLFFTLSYNTPPPCTLPANDNFYDYLTQDMRTALCLLQPSS
jgi:hypothetical protein